MPQTLRTKCIEIAHSQHQGISKTIARLREKVWWLGISADTESFIKSCIACQSVTQPKVKYEPLNTSEIPKSSWHTLAIDIKGPFTCGTNLLVLID